MAEKTGSKEPTPREPTPKRAVRAAIGIAAIGLLLAALGWMVPHFIAQPERATLTQETPTGIPSGHAPHWKAESIEEVPFGETVVLDDLTKGMKYDLETSSYLQEDWASMSEADKKAVMEGEGWDEEVAPFSARVVDCALVSPSAFAEWYPLYAETNISEGMGTLYADEDVRMVVVDVEIGNLGTEPLAPPNPLLRCPAFVGDYEMMDAGMCPDNAVQAAIYPLDGGDFAVGFAGGCDMVMPGETRVIRYGFVAYRNSFAERDGIEAADLSTMEIAYSDCDPWRIVALKLANARDAAQVPPRNAYIDGVLGR